MEKKGFTLIELLGVIVILGLVLGLAVLAFINNRGSVDTTYYKTLEESLLIPGGDYFNYNKGEQPGVYGDEKRVSAKILENGGYIEEEIVGSDKEPCDLQNSYVGAYKNSKDKTNYYACLVCGEYKTDSQSCNGEIDYTLGVRANKKESQEVYKTDGKNWSDEDIILTFETLNDMEEVELEDESGKKVGSCKLKESRGIKNCTIEISESGNYKAYAKNGKSETRKKDLTILIDKTPPTFDFENKGTNDAIYIKVNSNTKKNKVAQNVTNKAIDIKDSESGIKSIEYSFEKSTDKDYYHNVEVATTISLNKTLNYATYYLKVRVTNNAGLKTEKKLKYQLYYYLAQIPTAAKYCNSLTYNGKNQTIVKTAGTGYTFSLTKVKDAGDYKIIAKVKADYLFTDYTDQKEITCTMKKRNLTITAKNQEQVYGTALSTNSTGQVKVKTLQNKDKLAGITLAYSNYDFTLKTRPIIPSNAKITYNNIDVSNNYNISYVNGKLTLKPKITFTIEGTKQNGTNGAGYQKGAKVTVTCESEDEISSFVITDDKSQKTTLTGDTIQKNVITLNTTGANRSIKGKCTSITGENNTVTKKYHIYVYGASDACGCAQYNSKAKPPCSCKSRYSSNPKSNCDSWTKIESATQVNDGYGDKTGSWTTYSGDVKIVYTKGGTQYTKYKCTRYKCKTYYTCANSAFGCKTWKECWHG